MNSARIWFDKIGDAKYISHLDLVRFFGRALKRAGVPAWYTEGFNPHPYLNFAAPAPLGVESENDCVDMKLERDMPFPEVLDRLRAAMPAEIPPRLVTIPIHPFSAIDRAQYHYSIGGADIGDALVKFLGAEKIAAVKRGRKGQADAEIDLKQHMRDCALSADAAGLALSVTLPAGSRLSVGPLLLASALEEAGLPCAGVRRARLLLADGSFLT